jgi:hypothetical protein
MARSIRAASPYVVSVGGNRLTIPANRTSNLLIDHGADFGFACHGERSSPLEIGPLFCKVAEPGARDLPAKISLDISEAFL